MCPPVYSCVSTSLDARARRFVPVKDVNKGALMLPDAERKRASTFDGHDDRAADSAVDSAYEPPSMQVQLLPAPTAMAIGGAAAHRVTNVELLERRLTATHP
jgi:hypothetical protein